ncbi:MAG: hypothetical protein M3A44_05220 [Gammaproteobacteria bacterium]
MNKLLSMFFDVCRLRVAPQDLPTSRTLLVSTLAVYALLSIVISVVQMSLVKALLAAFMDTALLAGLSFFLLWARMFAHRWVQTCTALAGSGAVLEVVALPLMVWQKQFGPESSMVILPTLLLLVVLFWNLVVIGHILRHALSTNLGMGAVLATVYMYVSLSIIKILFFSGI